MKKNIVMTVIMAFLAVPAVTHASITYSGTALAGLDYSAFPPGTAQYVGAGGGNPALAALATPDAGLGPDSGDAAVFAGGSFGTLSQVTMNFDIYSQSGGGGNQPYGELWFVLPDSHLAAIIGFGGPSLDDASDMHVINTDQSYWGQTLGSILGDTYEGVAYGNMQVAYAGVGIGDWNIADSIGATANIDSITVNTTAPIPEPATWTAGALLLVPLAAGARSFRRKSPQTPTIV